MEIVPPFSLRPGGQIPAPPKCPHGAEFVGPFGQAGFGVLSTQAGLGSRVLSTRRPSVYQVGTLGRTLWGPGARGDLGAHPSLPHLPHFTAFQMRFFL